MLKIGVVIGIIVYLLLTYLNYCIVKKLNKNVGIWEMAMPVIALYRTAEVAGVNADRFVGVMTVIPSLCLFSGMLIKAPWIVFVGCAVAWGGAAYVLACIAQKMGKSFSLLFLLSLIPVVNISAYLLLAFAKEDASLLNT